MADLKLCKKLYGNDDRIYTYTVYVALASYNPDSTGCLQNKQQHMFFYFFSQVFIYFKFLAKK